MSEQKIHAAVAGFLDAALPALAWHSAIDPASKSSAVAGALLKARGGKAGIPDHIIVCPGQPAIFFEMKTARGRLALVQELVRLRIVEAGAKWFLIRSINDAEAALRSVGINLRASAGRIAA